MSGLELLLPFLPLIAGCLRGAKVGSELWDQTKANGRNTRELVSALELTLIQLEDGLTARTKETSGMKLAVDSLMNLSRDTQFFAERFAKKGPYAQSSLEVQRTITELRDRHTTVQNHIIIAFGLASQDQQKAVHSTEDAKSQAEHPYLNVINATFGAAKAVFVAGAAFFGAGAAVYSVGKAVVGAFYTFRGQGGEGHAEAPEAELRRCYGEFLWQGPQINTIAAVRYYSHAVEIVPTIHAYFFRLGVSSCWMCIRPDLFEKGPNGESLRDVNVVQVHLARAVWAVEQAHLMEPKNPEYHSAFVATQQELRRFENRSSRMSKPSFLRKKSTRR